MKKTVGFPTVFFRLLTKYDIKLIISKMNKTDKNIASLRDGSCTDYASADHEVVEGALRDVKLG